MLKLEDTSLALNKVFEFEDKFESFRGTIRYLGPLEGQEQNQIWVGVEWDETGKGSHDGVAFGKRYFKTPPERASFIKLELFISRTNGFLKKQLGPAVIPQVQKKVKEYSSKDLLIGKIRCERLLILRNSETNANSKKICS